MGFALALVCLACWADAPAADAPGDVLHEALLGTAEAVDPGLLMGAPGRYAGRAVRTQGRLRRAAGGEAAFELDLGRGRAALRLEPEVAAVVAARAASWADRAVEVEGFFYREASAGAEYALRSWRVRPAGGSFPEPPSRAADALSLSLQDLVYSAGRHDGRLVRVRGGYRGSNVHHDLPEATRKGSRDWVLKDGHFAAWVTGREARGEGWDLTRSAGEAAEPLEVVGVPATAGGVVRIAARAVEISLEGPSGVLSRALPTIAGWAAVPPRVSFAYPAAGTALGPRGHMIIQFSKPMDPRALESGVRVRYERPGAAPRHLRLVYRDRYRALVVTPDPPPPRDTDVIVELLQGVIDADGRALTPREPSAGNGASDVVERVRFRSARP